MWVQGQASLLRGIHCEVRTTGPRAGVLRASTATDDPDEEVRPYLQLERTLHTTTTVVLINGPVFMN